MEASPQNKNKTFYVKAHKNFSLTIHNFDVRVNKDLLIYPSDLHRCMIEKFRNDNSHLQNVLHNYSIHQHSLIDLHDLFIYRLLTV